jgi:protein-tyrosine kinase
MSKIEEALRRAGKQHSGEETSSAGHKSHFDDLSTTERGGLPVKYQLRPGVHHKPSTDVLKRHHIIHDTVSEDVLTQYKMLRTKVLQLFNTNTWKSLAVTSPRTGAGVTTTAINLAIALASHRTHNIVLVDLNFRDPSIADYLDIPKGGAGLGAYLERNINISDILWDIDIENLSVIAHRDRIKNSSEELMSARMRDFMHTVKNSSGNAFVIFDLPPVLSADDAVALSSNVDAFLMVVSEGETGRADLADAMETLAEANIVGVVLNKKNRR